MTLRVILQIVPFGDEDKTYEIGRLDIFNKGLAYMTEYDEYQYGVIDLTPKNTGLYTKQVYHNRQDGAWILLWRALQQLDITGP